MMPRSCLDLLGFLQGRQDLNPQPSALESRFRARLTRDDAGLRPLLCRPITSDLLSRDTFRDTLSVAEFLGRLISRSCATDGEVPSSLAAPHDPRTRPASATPRAAGPRHRGSWRAPARSGRAVRPQCGDVPERSLAEEVVRERPT